MLDVVVSQLVQLCRRGRRLSELEQGKVSLSGCGLKRFLDPSPSTSRGPAALLQALDAELRAIPRMRTVEWYKREAWLSGKHGEPSPRPVE